MSDAGGTRAVVLAGGRGTRLAPYTTVLPKPLMPVGDMPILEILVRQLRRAGINRITLAVGHLAALLEAYFGDGVAASGSLSITPTRTSLPEPRALWPSWAASTRRFSS